MITSNLERRYRLLLKVLPAWYRADREEEMVGLFMIDRTDELDLEHSWPGWGETFAMLGLAVRTRLAAGSALTPAPAKTVWLGEVVRALGMLGLLLGLMYLGPSAYGTFYALLDPEFAPTVTWVRALDLLPVAAFALLLWGKRTEAKIAAGVSLLPGVVHAFTDPGPGPVWLLYQVPSLVLFVCLCVGFHREAPTPPVRRMLWWGGGAALAGLAMVPLWPAGTVVIAAVVLAVRVFAFVRGDFVLGRALSVLAVLSFAPLVLSYVVGPAEFRGAVLVAAALYVVSAAAPVRRASVPRFRLP